MESMGRWLLRKKHTIRNGAAKLPFSEAVEEVIEKLKQLLCLFSAEGYPEYRPVIGFSSSGPTSLIEHLWDRFPRILMLELDRYQVRGDIRYPQFVQDLELLRRGELLPGVKEISGLPRGVQAIVLVKGSRSMISLPEILARLDYAVHVQVEPDPAGAVFRSLLSKNPKDAIVDKLLREFVVPVITTRNAGLLAEPDLVAIDQFGPSEFRRSRTIWVPLLGEPIIPGKNLGSREYVEDRLELPGQDGLALRLACYEGGETILTALGPLDLVEGGLASRPSTSALVSGETADRLRRISQVRFPSIKIVRTLFELPDGEMLSMDRLEGEGGLCSVELTASEEDAPRVLALAESLHMTRVLSPVR